MATDSMRDTTRLAPATSPVQLTDMAGQQVEVNVAGVTASGDAALATIKACVDTFRHQCIAAQASNVAATMKEQVAARHRALRCLHHLNGLWSIQAHDGVVAALQLLVDCAGDCIGREEAEDVLLQWAEGASTLSAIRYVKWKEAGQNNAQNTATILLELTVRCALEAGEEGCEALSPTGSRAAMEPLLDLRVRELCKALAGKRHGASYDTAMSHIRCGEARTQGGVSAVIISFSAQYGSLLPLFTEKGDRITYPAYGWKPQAALNAAAKLLNPHRLLTFYRLLREKLPEEVRANLVLPMADLQAAIADWWENGGTDPGCQVEVTSPPLPATAAVAAAGPPAAAAVCT